MRDSIRDLYGVETDDCDWPAGLPVEEREVLIAGVKHVLDLCKLLSTHELYRRVRVAVEKTAPVFSSGVVYDWLYACVVRAARAADCEQLWCPPDPPPAPAPKTRKEVMAAAARNKAKATR